MLSRARFQVVVLGLVLCAAGCHPPAARATTTIVPYVARSTSTSVLALPELGAVRVDRLVDGSLVWVVRTEADEVHVLAVDARALRRERPDAVHAVLTRFDPDSACFRGEAPVVWALDGSIAARSAVDYEAMGIRGSSIGIWRTFDADSVYALDRYEVTRDGDSVRVGPRWLSTVLVDPDQHLVAQVLDTDGPRVVRAIDALKRARP